MTETLPNERTSQSAPIAMLCDSVRASTTRYALLRRILLDLSKQLLPVHRQEMHTVIVGLDDNVVGAVEKALQRFCSATEEPIP